MITVYVSIGNSDDKLSQEDWSLFHGTVHRVLSRWQLHGAWISESTSPYQNACWCVVLPDSEWTVTNVKQTLKAIASVYRQDSITWAEAPVTEFLGPQESEKSNGS